MEEKSAEKVLSLDLKMLSLLDDFTDRGGEESSRTALVNGDIQY